MKREILLAVAALSIGASADAQAPSSLAAEVAAVYARADSVYLDLHRHPELSGHETQTAAKMAAELRLLGYEVTTGVGGTGVVGVLRNGAGPTVMLRTELDALPVTENTGLPYASVVRAVTDSGAEVGVAHACGHDIHMASWLGTARIMATSRNRWAGTLILIGQPAEETILGAKAMLADGLFTRFPRPDYALAVHDDARYPAGFVGLHAGPILANADGVNITIFGRGGHGARPEATVDPIVIAARVVLALQTIVSRETSPFDAAVITVGTINGGTKNNIIPDQVVMRLTVRSFTPAVREHLLAAIKRVAVAEAAAGAAPREPLVELVEGTTALVNDAALTARVAGALQQALGRDVVGDIPPEMASEDFSQYGVAGVPTLMMRVGAVEKRKYESSLTSGIPLPSLHSALFAPDPEPTIKATISAEVTALRTLLQRETQ